MVRAGPRRRRAVQALRFRCVPAPPKRRIAGSCSPISADSPAFVEARGENAAAELLDAYRNLVREQVAEHAGAEIRTEGDSFYVVFPSARSAVACGLGIAAAASRHSNQRPDRPIRLGIGINAGETTQHDDAFVGTAVNLAARCAARRAPARCSSRRQSAMPSGASPDLRFVSRGSRRLKGIAESVPLFAVETSGGVAGRSAARSARGAAFGPGPRDRRHRRGRRRGRGWRGSSGWLAEGRGRRLIGRAAFDIGSTCVHRPGRQCTDESGGEHRRCTPEPVPESGRSGTSWRASGVDVRALRSCEPG